MLEFVVWALILSPLWLLLPILLLQIKKEGKETKLRQHGSSIGISANYWAGYY
jgi:hypothetical protein